MEARPLGAVPAASPPMPVPPSGGGGGSNHVLAITLGVILGFFGIKASEALAFKLPCKIM